MIQFAHISDIHLVSANENHRVLNASMRQMLSEGRSPQSNFLRCLEELQRESLDFVLLTGDCVHEGAKEDYERLRHQFEGYLPGVPVIVSLGNHDDRRAFRQGFLGEDTEDDEPYYNKTTIDRDGRSLRILSLDSAWEKKNSGRFPEEQMALLEKELQHKAGLGTILLFHHPIMPLAGSLGLECPDRLKKLIVHSDVAAIFNGHIHSSYIGTFYGVLQATADSLAFGITIEEGRLVYHTQAGYHVCRLDEQGNYTVERRMLVFEEKQLDVVSIS